MKKWACDIDGISARSPNGPFKSALLLAGAAKAKEPATEAPTAAPAATQAPANGGYTPTAVVAELEARAAAQAAAYRAAKKVTPAPLQFTPFPDPMAKLREWMTLPPRPTRATRAPVTPDPVELERVRLQGMAREAFQQQIKMSGKQYEELRIRDQQLEAIAEERMRVMAEGKHAHPTATPPPAYGDFEQRANIINSQYQNQNPIPHLGLNQHLNQYQSLNQHPNQDVTALTPEQEAAITEKVMKRLKADFAKPALKKLEPASDGAFSQDDDDDVQQKEEKAIIRRAPTPTTTTPATTTTPPPTTVTQSAAPPTTTTPTIVFHPKYYPTTTLATPEDDPSASVFHRKDPLPITEFLEDRAALDTLSSIDVGAKGEEGEERENLPEGFASVADLSAAATSAAAGPFESLLKEAQEHLRESQQRVDALIKDQRLKIEREEKERKRLLEERRFKLAEQKRLLEERKKRREEKRKERLARQRLLAERANDTEWNRRLDQEAKVKALEDSTRVPSNSLENDVPATTTKRTHKKHRTTTTVEPVDDENEESVSAEAATSSKKQSRHAKNELDSDSYEAYEQWLRWREKRRLARRKHVTESEAEE